MTIYKLARTIANIKSAESYYNASDDDYEEEPSILKKSLPAILAGAGIGYGIINPLISRNSVINSYLAANPLATTVPEYISDTRNSQMLKSFSDLPINTIKNIGGAILGNSGPRSSHLASLVTNPALLGAAAGYAMYNYSPWVKKFGKMYARQELPWQPGFSLTAAKKLITSPENEKDHGARHSRARLH
jgi:hypothetical protein